MRSNATKLAAVLVVLAGFLAGPASALGAPFVNGIFPLESELGPNNKLVAGPDGNIWLTVEDATNDVASVTPAGQVQEFDIAEVNNPVGIALGPDGNLWVTDVEKAAKFAPADPEGTDQSFTVAGIGAEGQIVTGPDGLIWVASGNSLVRFNAIDPTGSVQPVTVDGELSPKDIDVVGGLIVIADNSAGNRIVTFTIGGTQKDFAIAGGSQGVAGAPSGQIGYSAPVAEPEQVGLITPPNPALPIPVPGDPFGVAFGSDGAYWVVQFAQGGLTRFTPTGETSFLGGLPNESARQIAAGPGNTLWVTLTKMGEPGVARVSGVEVDAVAPPPSLAPPRLAPQTKIHKGPKKVVKTRKKRAVVKFRFSSSTPGAEFVCSLRRMSRKFRKPMLVLKRCRSPKRYRLRPGRYYFQVRAVSAGVLDPSPAVRKFKIKRTR